MHYSKPSNNSFSFLLNDCMYFLCQFHQVKIGHVFQETNRCTDHLTKGGCTPIGNFVALDSPITEELCIILDFDASGFYFLRARLVNCNRHCNVINIHMA